MKNNQKAAKTVFIMVIAMILSKVLGLVRSMLMASHYGVGIASDAFSAASKIPLVFFDLLFGASILGCFIPIYNEFDRRNGDREADDFACLFLNFIFLLTSLLSVFGILFAPWIIQCVAPDLDPQSYTLAVRLLRIMFPMIIFTGSAYTLVGVMQSKNRFILPSLISSISNFGVILYFLFLDKQLGSYGLYGLAIAYLVSWALQFLTLCIPLVHSGFRLRPMIHFFQNPALLRALKMTPQVIIGSWLAPVGMLIGTRFASKLSSVGAVTIFDYTNNTYTIIVGILTYGICNFVFPKFARLSASAETEKFSKEVQRGITSLFYIVIPIMFAAFILSGEGISILYQRGKFNAADATQTAKSLQYMLFGMPAFCLIELLSRVMYAKKKAYASMCAAIVGILCNLLSTFLLTLNSSSGIEVIALGNAIGQIAAAGCLILFTLITSEKLPSRAFIVSCLKIFFCALVSYGAMKIVFLFVGGNAYEVSLFRNIVTILCVFSTGAVVYLLLTSLFHIKFELQGDEKEIE